MEFKVLGPLEVTHDGRLLELGAPRQKAVLAILLLHANEVVPTDRLAEALWSGASPKTASKAIHVYVSALRKALGEGRDVLETRGPGYVLRVGASELDLRVFEDLVARSSREEAPARVETLDAALSLWRGAPLADFTYEAFVQPEAARLEELRQHAREERAAAKLELGHGAELIGELQALVDERPLQERPRGLLMRALYRAGRHVEALEVFRDGARLLQDELGLEPGPALKEIERSILRHDPSLFAVAPSTDGLRSIVVVPENGAASELVLPLAEALAGRPTRRELVLTRVVAPAELRDVTATLDATRRALGTRGTTVRVAAFSSASPGEDLVRLGGRRDTDLLLVAADGDPLAGPYAGVFELATCDVGTLVVAAGPIGDGPVVVPFGAFEHDWAALEVGAWAALALERPLRLIGAADPGARGQDASRLLADASLIVQHTSGVVAEPLLGPPGRDGVAALAAGAGLLVVGLSERWRSEGLGETRSALVASPPAPMMLVRRGLRPSGIAPRESLTRFTWSIERSRI